MTEPDPRWLVETSLNVFEDVGATSLEIDHGVLIFKDIDGKVLVAYGPNTWRTVGPE